MALYHDGRGPLTSNLPEGRAFLSTRGDESVADCQFEMAPAMYFDEKLSMALVEVAQCFKALEH